MPLGVMQLKESFSRNSRSRSEAFKKAFDQACGNWLRGMPTLPVIASGMVGSREGWREAPYLSVPVDVVDLCKHLSKVRTAKGGLIHIVPGLMRRTELVNVMRGEETQILGALAAIPTTERTSVWVCLPGTHSKWARVRNTTVEDFETFMTGEVYAVLSKHSILARTVRPGAGFLPQAFDRGVKVAQSAGDLGVLSNIFSVRTFGLTGELSGEEQADYLSGLLIGHEIRALSALSADMGRPGESLFPLILAGEASLCTRYQRALELTGCGNVRIVEDATPRGLWEIAVRAGLVAERETDIG